MQSNQCMTAIIKLSKSVYDTLGDKILRGKARKSVEKVLLYSLMARK